MAYISCRDLCVGYDGKPVLKGLNFEVKAGDYLCIVGENGSGKSTLMKTILGLIPPITGKVEFSDGLKRTEIGYLPQQTVVQRSTAKSIACPRALRHAKTSAIRRTRVGTRSDSYCRNVRAYQKITRRGYCDYHDNARPFGCRKIRNRDIAYRSRSFLREKGRILCRFGLFGNYRTGRREQCLKNCFLT